MFNYQYQYLVVRTRLHGGGVVSRHKFRDTAEKAARLYEAACCGRGCAGVVTSREYEQLRERSQPAPLYSLCK